MIVVSNKRVFLPLNLHQKILRVDLVSDTDMGGSDDSTDAALDGHLHLHGGDDGDNLASFHRLPGHHLHHHNLALHRGSNLKPSNGSSVRDGEITYVDRFAGVRLDSPGGLGGGALVLKQLTLTPQRSADWNSP